MTNTFRAAYWIAADGQSDVLLTPEEMAGESDAVLMAEAERMIDETGLQREDGDQIVIGEWRGA